MSSGFDIVAAKLQLDVVSLLVDAMRAVDRSAPPLGHDRELECDRQCRRDEFCFAPRQVIHRDPIYARRQVIHPDPQYDHPLHVQVPPPAKLVEVIVEKSPNTQPLDPPWKSLPWENPAQISRKIKTARYRPDIPHKGMLLDCFI